jgi:hypothetical protein
VLDSETAAIIAGLSAIGGGAVVAAANYLISRVQARDAERAELRQALTELYDAIMRLDHRLRLEPEPGRGAQWFERVRVRLPLLADLGRLSRRLLDPQLEVLMANLSKALSAAGVTGPQELMGPIARITDLMGTWGQSEEDWWPRWQAACKDYFLLSRKLLGSDRSRSQVARLWSRAR